MLHEVQNTDQRSTKHMQTTGALTSICKWTEAWPFACEQEKLTNLSQADFISMAVDRNCCAVLSLTYNF